MYRFAPVLCLVLSIASAHAQEDAKPAASPFQKTVIKLSKTFGALHHIRSMCEPSESMVWRDSMRELIRIEDPSREQRRAMTESFNAGYHGARERFASCTPAAQAQAKKHAAEGARLAAQLDRTLR